ncbi:MAG: ATP:cob(I)alamin adenosyltransferase [Chloroflexi bacterium]|nr:ATP:cob(I)alamin adenosyltransferase [Chloroflexota bacterium]|tara:strand:+ start:3020 stop:3643 length:624 start_codon:yes stop_codon:yes gene_type:complete
MKIYTKGGDEGSTSFYGGKRVLKNDLLVSAYGEVDELNSSIGIALAYLKNVHINYGNKWWYRHFTKNKVRKNIIKQLENIQNDLFNIGFELATPHEEITKKEKTGVFKNFVNENDINDLEIAIDSMQDSLPPLDNFILPTGILPAAQLQLSRAICRRAERTIVTAAQEVEISKNVLVYINRLSDYLFVLARFIHIIFDGQPEKMWNK